MRLSLPASICVRRGGLWVAAALAVTGAFFAILATRLAFGSVSLPGPGFFPFFLGLILVGFALAIAIDLLRVPASGEQVECGHRDVIITVLGMACIALLFEPLGAYLTLGAFCFVQLVGVGRVRLWVAALGSVGAVVGVWVFFKMLLGVQLPNGPF